MTADARELEYTQVIIREVDRINEVVNDLLTLARPMTAKWVRTEVAELLDHAVRLVQPDARANAITFAPASTRISSRSARTPTT